jgi:hypothetical protein
MPKRKEIGVKNLVADRKSKEDNEITVVNLVGIWV